jgi:hypothetical protein
MAVVICFHLLGCLAWSGEGVTKSWRCGKAFSSSESADSAGCVRAGVSFLFGVSEKSTARSLSQEEISIQDSGSKQ